MHGREHEHVASHEEDELSHFLEANHGGLDQLPELGVDTKAVDGLHANHEDHYYFQIIIYLLPRIELIIPFRPFLLEENDQNQYVACKDDHPGLMLLIPIILALHQTHLRQDYQDCYYHREHFEEITLCYDEEKYQYSLQDID